MSQTIYDFLRRKIKDEIELPYSVWANVDEVDKTNKVCKVTPGASEPQITQVQLSGIVNPSDGVWIIPQVNSQVIVTFTGRDTAFVSMVSKIDEINVENSNYSFVINENGVILNDGNNGGLIIIANLINKLNTLENQYNQLRSDYDGHAHGGTTSDGATISPASTTASSVTNIQASDIENPDVKH